MKNLLLLAILFIPMISFGQLKKKDKKAIENYAHEMCGCFNELFKTLDPVAVEFIVLIAEEGEEVGGNAVRNYMENATKEEATAIIESFNTLSTNEFQGKIEKCDTKTGVSDELAGSIDSSTGNAYIYFYNYLSKDDACTTMKFFLDAAVKDEETSNE